MKPDIKPTSNSKPGSRLQVFWRRFKKKLPARVEQVAVFIMGCWIASTIIDLLASALAISLSRFIPDISVPAIKDILMFLAAGILLVFGIVMVILK